MDESIREVSERMQREWNERAKEDAHFYVAFGRRDQDDEEFFATAKEIALSLEYELKRCRPGANRRALEIGCGPGRLMKPMSRHFVEIHGVDVSDEMIARARKNLRDIPHAHPHHTTGSDLAQFADGSFDFVYSYAVFQHIPSRQVVMQYLTEAVRVLKPGGILRVQINGLDESAARYDTWSGVRISADEVRRFAREQKMQLLALEGARTQYMWVTMRKAPLTRIRRITNAQNSEPVAPVRGRFAAVTAWVESLPPDCDLNDLEVSIGGQSGQVVYIGPADAESLQQVNILLPVLHRTGMLPLEIRRAGKPLCEPHWVRVIPSPPVVPIVISVTDGINVLNDQRVTSGVVKVTLEEADPSDFQAAVSGQPVRKIDLFCTDPRPPRWEVNFHLPEKLAPGQHTLAMRLGKKSLSPVQIAVE